jgi:hypothetical protein
MDIEHLCWLREILVAEPAGGDTVGMEFSYDNGTLRVPRFFRVPQAEVAQARTLYQEWGGIRSPEYRRGTTAKGPSNPFAPSIKIWKENE